MLFTRYSRINQVLNRKFKTEVFIVSGLEFDRQVLRSHGQVLKFVKNLNVVYVQPEVTGSTPRNQEWRMCIKVFTSFFVDKNYCCAPNADNLY